MIKIYAISRAHDKIDLALKKVKTFLLSKIIYFTHGASNFEIARVTAGRLGSLIRRFLGLFVFVS